MIERQTINVSLPLIQEQFVRTQVASGRYRSVSEVMRDGLRLLQDATHRQLLETWLCDGLTPDEMAELPTDLIENFRSSVTSLIADGIESGDDNGWVADDDVIDRLRDRIAKRGHRS